MIVLVQNHSPRFFNESLFIHSCVDHDQMITNAEEAIKR